MIVSMAVLDFFFWKIWGVHQLKLVNINSTSVSYILHALFFEAVWYIFCWLRGNGAVECSVASLLETGRSDCALICYWLLSQVGATKAELFCKTFEEAHKKLVWTWLPAITSITTTTQNCLEISRYCSLCQVYKELNLDAAQRFLNAYEKRSWIIARYCSKICRRQTEGFYWGAACWRCW